jgi:hypothetical protein
MITPMAKMYYEEIKKWYKLSPELPVASIIWGGSIGGMF